MKRKNGEEFYDYLGNHVVTKETEIPYPKKCKKCCYYTQKSECFGCLDETGDCRPYTDDKSEVIFEFI